jgi:hypothetical protein
MDPFSPIPSAIAERLLAAGPLTAHQGGWDEILMVIAPILLFAGLLYSANRRANRLRQTADGEASEAGEAGEATAEPRNERAGPI